MGTVGRFPFVPALGLTSPTHPSHELPGVFNHRDCESQAHQSNVRLEVCKHHAKQLLPT